MANSEGKPLKAVLLDRDGVIVRERGEYNWLPEHAALLPHAKEALIQLHTLGIPVAVITNQGGIAKGLYSHEEVEAFHAKLREQLGEASGVLKAVYYCAHHGDFGECLCRKPEGLFLERAVALLGVEKDEIVFIGDHLRDMGAAEAAGVEGILIDANEDWWPRIAGRVKAEELEG